MTVPSNTGSRLLGRIPPVALAMLASASLHAEQPILIPLTGAAEVPPVVTAATASGQFTVLPDRTVSGSIKISGMTPTMAHIHEGPAGKNGPPIITLNQAAGNVYAAPAGAKLSEAQYTSYNVGNLYVNVHSKQYPDGEIRAQLPGKPMRLAN